MHGEIDRCLWSALGKHNFLYKWGSKVERNPSFLLDETDDVPNGAPQKEDRPHCYYETISNDDSRVAVWKMGSTSSSPSLVPRSSLQLTRDSWYIDGGKPHRYGPTENLTLDRSSISWEIFYPCRSREIHIVPSMDTSIRATPISNSQFGVGVLIGSGGFTRQRGVIG